MSLRPLWTPPLCCSSLTALSTEQTVLETDEEASEGEEPSAHSQEQSPESSPRVRSASRLDRALSVGRTSIRTADESLGSTSR